jgi:uncharacterized membrane protein
VRITWRSELPMLLLITAMLAAGAIAWPSMPERLPVHWDLGGQPDRWGGRFEALLLPPLVGAGIYLFLLFLPRLDPGRANYARFEGAYSTIRLSVIALLAGTYALMQLSYRGMEVNMTRAMLPLAGALLMVLGNVLGKVRPNWFVGIRTPWTLSSKQAWLKTHRLGGWLVMADGLLFIIAGAIGAVWAIGSAMVVFAVCILVLVVYSYLAWRADPDKIPPAGTLPADPG